MYYVCIESINLYIVRQKKYARMQSQISPSQGILSLANPVGFHQLNSMLMHTSQLKRSATSQPTYIGRVVHIQ